MDKNEILNKASSKKVVVGEMERQKINSGNWIALLFAGITAITFMIIEGILGHFSAIYALGAVCYGWAMSFFICQYFIAKRPWQVLIGAVLHGIGFGAMITLYILRTTGVL